jgi:hypothetical protein
VDLDAYALVGERVARTARVLDLSYDGVALEIARSEGVAITLDAVLHVPIPPPMRIRVRRVYKGQSDIGGQRVGCAFVTAPSDQR